LPPSICHLERSKAESKDLETCGLHKVRNSDEPPTCRRGRRPRRSAKPAICVRYRTAQKSRSHRRGDPCGRPKACGLYNILRVPPCSKLLRHSEPAEGGRENPPLPLVTLDFAPCKSEPGRREKWILTPACALAQNDVVVCGKGERGEAFTNHEVSGDRKGRPYGETGWFSRCSEHGTNPAR